MEITITIPKKPEEMPQADSQQIRRVANVLSAQGHTVKIFWGDMPAKVHTDITKY